MSYTSASTRNGRQNERLSTNNSRRSSIKLGMPSQKFMHPIKLPSDIKDKPKSRSAAAEEAANVSELWKKCMTEQKRKSNRNHHKVSNSHESSPFSSLVDVQSSDVASHASELWKSNLLKKDSKINLSSTSVNSPEIKMIRIKTANGSFKDKPMYKKRMSVRYSLAGFDDERIIDAYILDVHVDRIKGSDVCNGEPVYHLILSDGRERITTDSRIISATPMIENEIQVTEGS